MKATIICNEPFPNGLAGTRRIICYAKALIESGIPCEVVIFKWTEPKNEIRNTRTRGTFEGIPYRYLGGSTVKPAHKIPRIFREFCGRTALIRYVRKNLQKGDVVIGYLHGNPDFISKIIDKVHAAGAKYVRELGEIPFFGNTDPTSIAGLERTLSDQFPRCDGFITISGPLYELACKYRRPGAGILKLPILVEYEKIASEGGSKCAETPYIFHSGTLLEQKDGILGMIEAFGKARQMTAEPLRMVLSGRLEMSPEKDGIRRIAKEYKIEDDLVFTGYLDRTQVAEYLSGAAMTIINKHPNQQNLNGFSTKLADYLAAGKPVIITDVGEAMNWLEDGKDAIVVKHDDTDALSRAILRILSDKDFASRIGEEGRETCRRYFDYKNAITPLHDFMVGLQQ